MTPSIEKLAHEFGAALRSFLTRKEIQAVITRNRRQKKTNICHSHDFCDANMFLYDVFIRYGMDITEEGGLDRWCGLWNATWNLAKSREFRLYNRRRKFTNWRRIMKPTRPFATKVKNGMT